MKYVLREKEVAYSYLKYGQETVITNFVSWKTYKDLNPYNNDNLHLILIALLLGRFDI